MERLEIAGRVALVSGGAQGIGYETARALHARGARVAIIDLELAACERAARRLDLDTALGFAADVTDEDAVAAAVEATVQRYGRLDVVVANAGIAPTAGPVSALDHAEFDRVLEVNLGGVVKTVRQALPQVIANRGHVCVIASIYAFVNGAMAASYAMSKAAVEQLGRALRVELAPHGASAGVGYFGFVDTALVRAAFDDPLSARIREELPAWLTRPISAEKAGGALAAGIERRAAHTIRPRRWVPYAVLRGIVGPRLDRWAAGNEELRAVVLDAERAEGADRR